MSVRELYNKTVGIVGLGNIGRWIGRIVHQGFGAKRRLLRQRRDSADRLRARPARAVSLEELMSTSDIVALSSR
jgi:lactate dehydrogenase-like 2-hydroxyacid dehydrogenase